jgi:Ser/Thr protein kinase RdoA (MazF antagonist)
MSLLDHAPKFNIGEAVEIVKSLYGMDVSAEALVSERDQNFLVVGGTGERFVLKIANSLESRELLQAQNDAMAHLHSRGVLGPVVVSSRLGNSTSEIVSLPGAKHYVRLVTYLQGVPFAKIKRQPKWLVELGRTLGAVTKALSSFDHTAVHRDFHWDLANGVEVIDKYKALVDPVELRTYVEQFAAGFGALELATLPRSVIHGDANDYNIIVDEERTTIGVIDFGDMIYSYTVGELSVALAYVVLDESDPLSVVSDVVCGYVSRWQLNSAEAESVWPLMLMRLCMSVCLAAHQQAQQPGNKYLDISQRSIRESLPRLLEIDGREVSKLITRISEK